MPIARRIGLNPCDYLYYAHHQMLQRTTGSGNIAFMMLDVEGRPEPGQVRQALAAAMAAHPITMSRLRICLLTGKPYWYVPGSPAEAAVAAAADAFTCDDLQSVDHWEERLEALSFGRYAPDWDLANGPQVKLEQYLLPNDHTRFCIRWPHLMMDAEGAQLFLSEIGRLDQQSPSEALAEKASLPNEIAPDDAVIAPFRKMSWLRRWQLFRGGFSVGDESKTLAVRPMAKPTGRHLDGFGLIQKHWDASDVQRMQDNAKRYTPKGPLLYARYLAACVIRALHRLHTENHTATEAYLITLPLRVTMKGSDGEILKTRPIPGNYLVAPTLYGLSEKADDKAALGEDILRQLMAYHEAEGDLKQWAMAHAARHLRASFYRLIFRLPLGFERLSSGFSYYGEALRQVRTFGGARVLNAWGGGPLATPPGWNPVFSRYQDRLNLTFTWNRPDILDRLAKRYVELIEAEIFERD